MADPASNPTFRTLRLQDLSPAIKYGQVVTVSYTDLTDEDDDRGVIEDAAGNDVVSFTTGIDGVPAVVNNVPNAAPDFGADSATRKVAENSPAGTDVGDPVTATDDDNDTLTYTLEGTDAASFHIVSANGQIQTTSGVTYDFETKSSYSVTVKADDGNDGTATIAVAIDLLDVDEAPATAPTVSSMPMITSDPGADDTYAIGDTVAVTVTFDQAVTVTGTPRITLRIGGGALENQKWADYASGAGEAALRFAYTIAEDDADADGIYLEADELELNNGTITGVNGGLDATLTYTRPGQQDDHKVDGVRPTPTGAVIPVDGDTITLTFNEPLSATTASTGTFTVTVAGNTRSVSSVAANDTTVTLTLRSPALDGEAASVTYTDPSAGDDGAAVQDAAGNDAETFTQIVTNNSTLTEMPDVEPSIDSKDFVTVLEGYGARLEVTLSAMPSATVTVGVVSSNYPGRSRSCPRRSPSRPRTGTNSRRSRSPR